MRTGTIVTEGSREAFGGDTEALVAATPALRGARRRWLLLGVAASAVTTGAMALPSSIVTLAALRFAGGMASAFVLIFASALVLDRLRAAGRSDLAAVHFAGVGAGIAVSAGIVSVGAARGGGRRGGLVPNGAALPPPPPPS